MLRTVTKVIQAIVVVDVKVRVASLTDASQRLRPLIALQVSVVRVLTPAVYSVTVLHKDEQLLDFTRLLRSIPNEHLGRLNELRIRLKLKALSFTID